LATAAPFDCFRGNAPGSRNDARTACSILVLEEHAMERLTSSESASATGTSRLPPSWPRPEARLYGWAQLTEEQKRALAQSAAIFQTLAKRTWPSPNDSAARSPLWSFLHQIETERFNQNVLIDGGRGTGKTVVLLHLVNYWSKLLENDGQFEQESDISCIDKRTQAHVDKREAEGNASDAPGGASEQRGQRRTWVVVPVGIVDLQPLPRSTNLALFLCSHFERVVTAIEQSHGTTPSDDARARKAPWSALRGDLRSRELWTELRDAAALGSDHIAHRSAHLDAETYALELEAAERSRKLNVAFGRFISALVRDFQDSPLRGSMARTPFFVLAIDDADMNLRQSVNLLESLRQLSHDRVGYVLTGHSDLFVVLLRNRIAGALRDPLQRLDLEERDGQVGDDFAVSQQMATQIYDKVVPNAHRCALRPLGLLYRRDQLDSDLHRWHLPVQPLPCDRAEMIAAGRPVQSEVQRSLRTYFHNYDLPLGALPETWRGLQDLREVLVYGGAGHHGPDAGVLDTPRLIRDLWHDRLDGAPLSPNDRQLLRDVVRVEELEEHPASSDIRAGDPSARSVTDPVARSGKFVVQTTRITRDIYPRRLQGGRLDIEIPNSRYGTRADRPGEATFTIGELLSYEFRYQNDAGRTVGLLSEGAAAALVLATDVAADLTTGTFLGRALSPGKFDHPLLTVSVYDEFFSQPFEFCWPLPDWDAFVDFHLVSRRWSRIVRGVIGIPNPPKDATLLDALVFPFVATAAEVAFARLGSARALFGTLPPGDESLIDSWLRRFHLATNDLDAPPSTAMLLPNRAPKARAARADSNTPAGTTPETPPVPPTFFELWQQLGMGLQKLSNETHVQRDFDTRDWVRTRVPLLAFAESGLSRTMQDAVLHHLVQPVLMPEYGIEGSAEEVRITASTNPGIAAARRLRARNARLATGKEGSITVEQWTFRRGREEFSNDQLVSLLLLPFGDVTDSFAENRRVRSPSRASKPVKAESPDASGEASRPHRKTRSTRDAEA
jgi:hypothetical protein